jgi:hypothetical protein
MNLSPGSLVTLLDRPGGSTYQVINVDAYSERVWVRRWPLTMRRSPTFSVAIDQVQQMPAERCA